MYTRHSDVRRRFKPQFTSTEFLHIYDYERDWEVECEHRLNGLRGSINPHFYRAHYDTPTRRGISTGAIGISPRHSLGSHSQIPFASVWVILLHHAGLILVPRLSGEKWQACDRSFFSHPGHTQTVPRDELTWRSPDLKSTANTWVCLNTNSNGRMPNYTNGSQWEPSQYFDTCSPPEFGSYSFTPIVTFYDEPNQTQAALFECGDVNYIRPCFLTKWYFSCNWGWNCTGNLIHFTP